jgi:hypothetical protein
MMFDHHEPQRVLGRRLHRQISRLFAFDSLDEESSEGAGPSNGQ